MTLKNEIYNKIVKSIGYDRKKYKKKRNIFIWEDKNIYKEFSVYKSKYSTDEELSVRVEWFVDIKKENSLLNKLHSNNNEKWSLLIGNMQSFYHSNNDFFEIDTTNKLHEENNVIEKINYFIENDLDPFFQKINSLEDIISLLTSSSKEMKRWYFPRSKEFSEDHKISDCYLLLSQIDKAKEYLYSRKQEIEGCDLLPGKKRGYISQIDELLEEISKVLDRDRL